MIGLLSNTGAWRFNPRPWIWLALIGLYLTACAEEPIPKGQVVYTHNSMLGEPSAQGANIKVLSFEWRYLPQTDQIHVTGLAQNMSSEDVQGGHLTIQSFDQFNSPMGVSTALLNPTYLQPGKKAKFDFYLQRGHWVEALRIHYRYESNY